MKPQHQHSTEPASRDLERVRKLVASGYDLNPTDHYHDTPLRRAILRIRNPRARMRIVLALLAAGAGVGPYANGSGPLFAAVIQQDTDVMQVLLDHGAAADKEHDMGDPIYSWAKFDYRYEAYGWDDVPEKPTAADQATEDTWLEFLDRLAIKYNKRRPDYLFLLRRYGARTYAEMHPKQA